jgi:long-subunit fatty acid transport protein
MRALLGLITLSFGVFTSLFSQSEFDALRYSTLGSGGTARTMGMAGSFSAIGADASAVMTNPAGIATFRRSEFNVGAQSTMPIIWGKMCARRG